MIKKFLATLSFLTLIASVSNAEETAVQKCMYILENAKPNMQRKAAIYFKDCVRTETQTLKVKGIDTSGVDAAVNKALNKIGEIIPSVSKMTKEERAEAKAEKKRVREAKKQAKKDARDKKKAERAARIKETKDKIINVFKGKKKDN